MKNLTSIFLEPDGSWSWRKTGTALCFILFAFAVVGFAIAHKFEELPKSYQGIIALVFSFYFFKNTINNLKSAKNE